VCPGRNVLVMFGRVWAVRPVCVAGVARVAPCAGDCGVFGCVRFPGGGSNAVGRAALCLWALGGTAEASV